MLGFVASMIEGLDEGTIHAEWEVKQRRKAAERDEQLNREQDVEEVLFAEDYQPTGRSSRARDAFRRAAE